MRYYVSTYVFLLIDQIWGLLALIIDPATQCSEEHSDARKVILDTPSRCLKTS